MTSTAIYTCYRQLHPPTGVDHAVFGSVTAPNSHDLVVAKASILELYRVHRDASPSSPSGVGGVSPQGDATTGAGAGYFLELVGTFPIAGNITALAVIPVGRSTSLSTQQQQDILMVSFDFAKTALVAYDSTLGRMSTLSIHNFDPDAIGPGSGGVEPSYGLASALKDRPSTIYSCDPAGRCLSAVVAGCLLVVLPTLRYVPPTVFLSEEAKKRVLLPRRHRRSRDPELQSDNADLEVEGAAVVKAKAAAVEGASRSRFGSDLSEDPTDRSSTGIGGRSKVDDAKGRTNGFVDAIGVGLGAGDEDQDGSNGKGLRDDYGGDDEEEEEASSDGGEAKQDAGGAFAVDDSRASRVRPTVSKPFTLDLEAVGVTGFIKAAVFLEGFHEPALALLYEPIQTCPGRLASMRSTCRLLVLSLNLVQGRAPVIWRVDNLPHDSWDLVAVPAPIGGVQVISTNAVIHVNDSEVLSILAVNGYARATVEDALLGCPLRASSGDWDWASFRHSRSALEVVDLSSYDVCVELDVMSCAFVTPTSMLFSLKGGEVYTLRLHVSPSLGCGVLGASGRVVGQSMRPIGRATPCSVLAVSARGSGVGGSDGDDDSASPSTGLIFMGSRVGDSLLVDYEVAMRGARSGGRGGSTAAVAAKREPKEEAGGAVRARTSAGEKRGVVGEAPVEAGGSARSSGAGGAPDEGCGTSGGAEGVGVSSAGSALPGEASHSLGGGDGNDDDDVSGREESEGRTLARGGVDSGKEDAGETHSSAVASAVETETGPSEERGAPEESVDGMEAATDGSPKDTDPRAEESDAEGQRKKRVRDEALPEGSGSGGQEKMVGEDGAEGGEEANGTAEPPRKAKKLCVSTSEAQLAAPEIEAAEAGSDRTAVVSATSGTGGQDDRDELMNDASRPLTGSTRLSDAGASPAEERGRQQKGVAAATTEHALRGEGNPSTAGVVWDRKPSSTTQGPSVSPSPKNEVPLEDRETIAEEEELYGAGLGTEPEGNEGGGRELSRLGSRDGERVVEAVGFRLKVVDSLCTLGPIVDAALVPSAYHVPRAAIAPGGASSRSGSWVRGGGGGVARGGRGGRTRSPSPLPSRTPPPLEGGTSGGGIRTTLVCAAGYGQQGSLAVFSAGLRTEVVMDLAVPGATGVFAAPEGVIGEGESRGDTLVLVSSSPLTEQRASAGSGGGGSGGGGDKADGKGHTRVLAFEDDLRVVELVPESEGNPFVCDAATVDLCAMAGNTIVQAHAQGLRVTRRREFVQEVLAAEDREMDGLGAGPDVTVLRAAAAGAFACCLLSNSHLHLMALEAGEPKEADLMPVGVWEEDDSKAENGGGGSAEGVWTDVEAMCIFGVRETLLPAAENSNATASVASAAASGQSADPSPGIKAALQTNGVSHQLFLEEAAEEIPDQSEVAAELAADEAGGEEDGFTSEEEWATLYGTGGGESGILGVLPSCPCDDSLAASSDGKEPSGARGFATAGPSAGQTKGWWGGDAWGEDLHSSSGDGARGGCEQTASAYLVVCRKEGALEIHACQGRGKEATTRTVFRASKAVLAPSTLWNELLLVPSPTAQYMSESESDLEALSLTANGEAVSPVEDDARGGDDHCWSSPTGDDGDGEGEGGGRGLGVATGVVAADGRRLERAVASNGSASSRSVGRETASHSEPMDVESPRCDTARTPGANSAPEGGGGDEDDGVVCPAVSDVLVHPVGAVDGPAALRRLILAMHLDNGDLLVYQARMTSREGGSARGGGREQVICFSKLSHDLITRPVKGVPPEAAVPDPSRGRALRGVRFAVGQEGICFARPGCRSALILAERGAVCVTPIAQDDLGDGSGSPPLPPGAPPSWAGVGLGSLAPLNKRDAFPGGGFAAVTAGGGRLRFISAAPASAQLVTPGTSGGGGLGGGGQGHFVAAKIGLGSTVHGVLHLPHELAQPGKMGDILKSLLLKRGHYAVLVSKMEDTLAEQPLEEEEQDDGHGDPADGEDEEVEGPLARHAVKHKNWTVADPALGGAPQLLVHKFELRVLALAPGAAAGHSPSKRFHRDTEGVDGSTGGDRGREDSRDDDSGNMGRGGIGVDGGGISVPGEVLSASTVETHPFDADENALCMSLVRLEQGGSPRMHVAVGTGMNDAQGEDKAARGRLLLFEVDYAYLAKEDGGHEHAVKLRQVFAKEQLGPIAGESGPVSAVAQLGRHLILSVGKKVIVNRWDPKTRTLELIGFYDPRVYVIGLSVIKNRFVLVGDAYGSVQLVVWREDDHSLTQLSKDHEKCEVFATEYLVDEPGMGIVVADGRRNLKVLQYAPKAPNSRGGTMLLCQSDFFLGSRVAKLTRRRTRGNLRGGARYCLLAGTLDGGLGAILPVDERIFRRLYALQGIMSNALGHTGSANPRAYRLFDRGPTFRYETKQNMLDGTLLWRFVGLDARTQNDLTRAIGTTVERVMSNLLDIDLASLF